MTSSEAREILLLYRPDSPDAADPMFTEALALAKRDEELGRWFTAHCDRQRSLREGFRRIPVPTELRERITRDAPSRTSIPFPRRNLLAAAALIAALGVAALLLTERATEADDTFEVFRSRMVSAVLRNYAMALETPDPSRVREFLAAEQAPADYELPPRLASVRTTGCGVLSWRDRRVSMVCFHSGNPVPPGQQNDLFLFIVDRSSLSNPPPASPDYLGVKTLGTAGWTRGERAYLLAAFDDETSLRALLGN